MTPEPIISSDVVLAPPEPPILEWRREQLVAVGFPRERAHALALDRTVDVRHACRLAASAGHELAWRILEPIDEASISTDLVPVEDAKTSGQGESALDRIRRYV